MNTNPQGVHAEDIGNDPHDMTPSGVNGPLGPESTLVPPPAYTDPSNPAAMSGSVNLSLNDHPLEISEDFGAGLEDAVSGPVSTQRFLDPGNDPNTDVSDKPREEWTNADFKAELERRGLPTSGNKAELTKRLKDAEKADAKAEAAQEQATEDATEQQNADAADDNSKGDSADKQ